jgi:hypothetical protein
MGHQPPANPAPAGVRETAGAGEKVDHESTASMKYLTNILKTISLLIALPVFFLATAVLMWGQRADRQRPDLT